MILKTDVTALGADDAVAFQAYIKSRAIPPSGTAKALAHIREGFLVARSQAATNIRVTISRDFGESLVAASTVSLAPEGAETKVTKRLEELQNSDITYAQLIVGDSVAVETQWSIEMVWAEVERDGER